MREVRHSNERVQRRHLLKRQNNVLRPPWTSEMQVRENCTSCGECIKACPEAILFAGPARTPTVDFTNGFCTFCGDCAAACDEGVFRDVSEPPWSLKARILPNCLLSNGISCRSCTDACDTAALRFNIRAGSVGAIEVATENCTGCGACVGMCPVESIALEHQEIIQQEVAV